MFRTAFMTSDRRSAVSRGILVLLAAAAGIAFPSCRTAVDGRVVAVKDGDTIEVLLDGAPRRIRLYGVDCPEKSQAFGRAARDFTSSLCFGRQVTLKQHGTDRYGRTIADVILPDGRSLNRELVRAGFAWWYRQYSDDPTLGDLERDARQARRGLWSDPRPVPPWEFRKGAREATTPPSGAHAIVYASPRGSVYHAEGCPRIPKTAVPMDITSARQRYRPCGRCNPDR